MLNKRFVVKKILSQKFSNAECIEIDKQIYSRCELYVKDGCVETLDELYSAIATQRVGELLTFPEKKKDILVDMQKDKTIGWNSIVFQSYKEAEKQATRDKIIGVKIKKGDFKCRSKTCGSNECFYYSMQTRGCDEPATVYIICSKCGDRFTIT